MRKGYIYYKDPRDNSFVKPKQGQYYLTLDQNGLMEVRGDQGQSVSQTQFIGTGSTTPGEYLPIAGGIVNGGVLFKGDVDFTSPVEMGSINATTRISSGGTDLSVLFSNAAGPLSTYTNGADNRIITSTSANGINGESNLTFNGSALVVTGSINATTTIYSGGTDLSVLFSNAAGPLSTYTNGADNRIITSTSANGINGESNLTFNGSALVVTGSINATTTISSGGTDLSVLFSNAAGPLSTYTNGADNRIITSTAANGINGESNLTFNGSALVVTGSINATTTISSGGTDLSVLFSNAAGPLSTYTNGADNRIITSTAANGINGESNLTFNGSALVVTGSINATTTISSGGTDLSVLFSNAAGPLSTYTNGADNRIITSTAANGINGESNLTFNGSALVVTGSINATTTISSGGTDLSVLFSNAAGPLSTYTNGADNRIITSTAANGINGESNLTFNGSALVVTGSINATTTISSGGTDLSVLFSNAAGPLSTYTNGADNRIITSTAANGINGESNLTFNGSALVVTGSINATTTISSGGTDLSALFRGAGDAAGWVTNLVNYTTLNEATENPILIRTTRTTAVSAGGVYYLSTNGTWNQADASASGTSIGFLGMAQTTSSDNPGMLASGIVLIDSSNFDGTAVTGGTIYLSESTSKFTFAPPTTSGAVVRAVGHFIEDFSSGRSAYYSIYFNPSHDYFVIS